MNFAHILLAGILLVMFTSETSAYSRISSERYFDGARYVGGGRDSHASDTRDHSHFDHEAIIGSAKMAMEFDHLTPEESKSRLLELLKRADTKKDEIIDRAELLAWIKRSFELLSKEEANDRFSVADGNRDGKVTWNEYLGRSFEPPEEDDTDGDKMLENEKALFNVADANKNKALDKDEFLVFTVPEEHPVMHPHLVAQTLQEKDKDGDGYINFQEFIDKREGDRPDKEWLIVQQEKFREEYDKNRDGKLNSQEILNWILPSSDEVAKEEVSHLFATVDDNHDNRLSFNEVLEHYDVFVGSEVTDYGDHLYNVHLFDEL